jgi:heme a synthase
MAEPPPAPTRSARWLHRWALLTVAVTLPLLLLGAEVTTKQVGMVDKAWPTWPWQLWLSEWRPHGLGYLIEHGHRLAGYTVGTCVIVLVAGLWLTEPRRWLCWLGTAALVGVCLQGLLGGLRVRLNDFFGTDLALIHGCFGQMVVALLVSVALCTSRRWAEPTEAALPPEETAALRRWSLLVTGLLVLQLFLGAVYRHRGSTLGLRGHLLVAFAVVAAVAWLVKLAREGGAASPRLTGAVRLLVVLVAVQLLLGVEALMVKLFWPEVVDSAQALIRRDLVRSGHVLVGSVILATSVVVSLEAQRRTAWAAGLAPAAARRLEGAA